ncbi:MAG TPA: hypothetical protein ENN55_02535 [Firmicutes bacterium]|nr:hypothetical protein [Bacillota bacterium]
MEIEDSGKKKSRIRSIENQFLVEDGRIIVENRDMDNEAVGMMLFEDIEAVNIKPAGTLYDGEVEFLLKKGIKLNFKIKKYQEEDFVELKSLLGK